MSAFECPYCHHSAESVPLSALRHIQGSGIRRVILRLLMEAFPGGLHKRVIENRVYGNGPSGGPEFASGVISNNITALRDELRVYGWTIPNYARAGRLYKLAPMPKGEETRMRAA